MFLKWLRPKEFYRTVDVYNVLYRVEDNQDWDKQIVETVNNTINHMVGQSPKYVSGPLKSPIYLNEKFLEKQLKFNPIIRKFEPPSKTLILSY